MGQLIGITGTVGSGKTTLAAALARIEPSHALYECSEPIIEVADEFNTALQAELTYQTAPNDTELVNQVLIWLIDTLQDTVHVTTTWAQIALTPHHMAAHPELYRKLFSYLTTVKAQPQLLSIPITTDNKETYRDILQWIGGYFLARLTPSIWEDELFHRIDLHDTRTKLVIISGIRYTAQAASVRAHGGTMVAITRPSSAAARDTDDVTEAQQASIVADITIVNNGDLAALDVLCENLMDDLIGGHPHPRYQAV